MTRRPTSRCSRTASSRGGCCIYDIAENYDFAALQDDGPCEFILQSPCPTDLNQDGATTTADLEFLISFVIRARNCVNSQV